MGSGPEAAERRLTLDKHRRAKLKGSREACGYEEVSRGDWFVTEGVEDQDEGVVLEESFGVFTQDGGGTWRREKKLNTEKWTSHKKH